MGSLPGSKTQDPSENIHLLTTVSLIFLPINVSLCINIVSHSLLVPCFSFCHGHFLMSHSQNHGENTKIFQLQQLWFKCSNSDNFNTNSLSFHTWYLVEIQRSCRARQLPRALQQDLTDREHIFKQTP